MKRLVVTVLSVGMALGGQMGAASADDEPVVLTISGVADHAVLRGDTRVTVQASGGALRTFWVALTRAGGQVASVVEKDFPQSSAVAKVNLTLDWVSARMPNGWYTITASASDYGAPGADQVLLAALDNHAPDVQSAAVGVYEDRLPLVRWCWADAPDLLGYDVERQVDDGEYVRLARVESEVQYVDPSPPAGQVRYRVSAVRNSVVSASGLRSPWRATNAITVNTAHPKSDPAVPEPVDAAPDCPPAVSQAEPGLREVGTSSVSAHVLGIRVTPRIAPIARRTPTPTISKAGTAGTRARPAPLGTTPPLDGFATADRTSSSSARIPLTVAASVLVAGLVAGLAVWATRRRRARRVPAGPVAAGETPGTQPETRAQPAPPRSGRQTAGRFLVAGPKQLGAAAALVVGVSGAFFVVRPNLKPSTENVVEVTNVAVEPDVTLLGYARHPAVLGALDRAGGLRAFVDVHCEALGRVGTVVHLDYEVKGYAEHSITVRWSLIDGKTGRRLMESEGNDPLPLSFRAGKRDTDVGSWELWVPALRGKASVKARIELYDTAAKARLAFKDSPAFAPPSRADRTTGPC